MRELLAWPIVYCCATQLMASGDTCFCHPSPGEMMQETNKNWHAIGTTITPQKIDLFSVGFEDGSCIENKQIVSPYDHSADTTWLFWGVGIKTSQNLLFTAQGTNNSGSNPCPPIPNIHATQNGTYLIWPLKALPFDALYTMQAKPQQLCGDGNNAFTVLEYLRNPCGRFSWIGCNRLWLMEKI